MKISAAFFPTSIYLKIAASSSNKLAAFRIVSGESVTCRTKFDLTIARIVFPTSLTPNPFSKAPPELFPYFAEGHHPRFRELRLI
jgi:hypothetical protein